MVEYIHPLKVIQDRKRNNVDEFMDYTNTHVIHYKDSKARLGKSMFFP